ncbi:MAG TPA: ABC transporter ATP-binding protein [Flavisolibacter sp.]|nr:ABC transporter ATP-binding protein [Flavisolibacter sp.]
MSYSNTKILKRTIQQARPYWQHIALMFVLMLLASPIALFKPYALKLLIDSGFGKQPLPGFVRFFFPDDFIYSFSAVVLIAAVLYVVIALVENTVNMLEWVVETYAGEKLVLNFRTTLFNHIQRLSIAYHDQKGSSDALYRLQWDTVAVRTFLLTNLSPLISSIFTLVCMIVVMFTINWVFAMIALCIMPPLFFLIRFSTKKMKRGWNEVKEDESIAMSVVHEVLSSLRVVKAFGQEDNEGQRFAAKSNRAVKGQLKMAWFGAGFYFVVGMTFAIATALFIYLGANYIQNGKMTLGELTLVLAYIAQIFGPLQNISKKLNDVQSSISSLERVFTLLDHETEVKETNHPVPLPKAKGAFQFSDVSFWYQKEKPTLQQISFSIKPGDRVGIMGSTGSGKTTLISLLMRFYDAREGTVSIDGADIRKFRLADYRNQFSIVLQDPVLFSTTIRENIRYGKPGATDKEIVEAAKAANAHEFIMRSKDGYDTMVGERGMQLSGGERQRISLARAFIKNAPVLILDEPTSSLDIKTESLIMEAMERLMAGRTSFMITHRLDTLRTCNVILHLEYGKLIDVIRDYDIQKLEEKKLAVLNQL